MHLWRWLIIMVLLTLVAYFVFTYAPVRWQNATTQALPATTVAKAKAPFTQAAPNNPGTQAAQSNTAVSAKVKAITAPSYLPPIATRQQSGSNYLGDLADKHAYQAYLDDQEVALKRSYIDAVDTKAATLERLLQRGIKAGLPQPQLQQARDKIAGLKQLQEELKQALDGKSR